MRRRLCQPLPVLSLPHLFVRMFGFATLPVQLVAVVVATPASALVASSADNVCAASSDPCVVSHPVEVAAGSHLDFGLRTLVIEGSGVLDFADGRGAISCGRLEAATSGPAIRARAGSAAAATLTILARRRCSAAALACLTDADCAGAGSCTSGDGRVELRGGILGNADVPGHVVVRSSADLAVHGSISIAGTRTSSDGGRLMLESAGGSVLLAGAVDVSSGGGGSGGDVSVVAARDIALNGQVDATGGEYDGGAVSLDAGRDVILEDDIAVDATSGAGAGGEIDVIAGRDIVMSAGTASNNVVVSADGHQSVENDAGDGGTISFEADGSIRLGRYARFVANAAAPDGFGDSLDFSAEQDLDFDAAVVAKGRGTWGGGALVDLYAGGDVRVGADASFDLTGSAAGGDLMVEAGQRFVFEGSADVSGSAAGIGGRIVSVSRGDSEIAGAWTTGGRESVFTVGEVFVEGCRLRVSGGIANGAEAGRNRFVAHDGLTVTLAAAIMASGEGGTNVFVHRGVAGVPEIDGSVVPAPAVSVDASLAACAVCGNAALEGEELCDDGNALAGDGCSARCEDEGCVAASPGYPATPLCDDANACTSDRCNAALHVCEHAAVGCSDGIDCTTDACSQDGCVHAPVAARCDDLNACTGDVCDALGGCMHEPVAGPCDDGAFCNGADACMDGTCALHAGDPCAAGADCAARCDEARDSCHASAGAPCGDDAGACTDDVCDGNGSCVRVATEDACDDGDYCTTGEHCRAGICGDDAWRPLVVARLRSKRGEQPGEDRLVWKAGVPGGLLPRDPAGSHLRVVLSDALSRPLVDVTLPAGSLVRERTGWRFRRGAEEPSFLDELAIVMAGGDGWSRVRARLSGLDLSQALSAASPRLTILFGDEPDEAAACLSSSPLECRSAKGRLACASPR